jgi:hypothetical protein
MSIQKEDRGLDEYLVLYVGIKTRLSEKERLESDKEISSL